MNDSILYLEYEYCAWSESSFAYYTHCYVMWCNDGNCRLTMPIIKGGCARDLLPHTFNISEFKSVKKNSTTIKHLQWICIIEGCNVPINDASVFNESMVTCAHLRYTQDYLMPGIYSLIKPAAVEKLMPLMISRQNPHSHVIIYHKHCVCWWPGLVALVMILTYLECNDLDLLHWL